MFIASELKPTTRRFYAHPVNEAPATSLINSALFAALFFSVWLPVLIAILARRSPVGVRVVLALSGIAAGLYARSIWAQIPRAGGHERGWAFVLVPITTTALSFYLAFTGVCAVTALHYIVAGRSISPASLLAFGLLAASLILGVLFGIPLLSWPIR